MHRLHVVEDGPLRYLRSVPAVDGDGPRPVLCFLHGYDEAAPLPISEALTRHGPLRSGHPAIAADRFVIVAPQLVHAGDVWREHADAVRQIVDRAIEEHDGDPRRAYLSGFSFGGNGVFDLAIAQPRRWAALWSVDPTRAPTRDPGRPVWLSIGAAARRRTGGFVDALGLRPAGAGEEAGDRVYTDGGEDHVGSARTAYADARIYRWLLARTLPDDAAR